MSELCVLIVCVLIVCALIVTSPPSDMMAPRSGQFALFSKLMPEEWDTPSATDSFYDKYDTSKARDAAEETQEAQAANVKHYVRPRMCQLLALPMMFRLCVLLCMAEVCLCPRYSWTSCNLTLRLQAPGFGFLAKMHRK